MPERKKKILHDTGVPSWTQPNHPLRLYWLFPQQSNTHEFRRLRKTNKQTVAFMVSESSLLFLCKQLALLIM